MGKQEEFIREARRIVTAAREQKLALRLLGALAFNYHCPRYNYLQEQLGRVFTDIDFAGRSGDREAIRKLFAGLGYVEDMQVTILYGEGRLVFNNPRGGWHSDVFLDKLEFCHDIPLARRLEVDELTIPLAEMLLEKMQIVKINQKDIIDTIMLLREHEVGTKDTETINGQLIAELCARDWGLWRTVTMNLEKVSQLLEQFTALTAEDVADVRGKIQILLAYIARQPKSTAWKLRHKIGERVKWYKEVDELGH
ncbi:hypothetical protein [Moorella sulfitireducens (nom. illeg.)]|uniref:hypothetical protein n=1 Tax=Neomoorella sulfitireducens TaxID=2972948 RepID=UPI0021ABDCDD|nr:hypothetical protein [Moorella sulfitireducens]